MDSGNSGSSQSSSSGGDDECDDSSLRAEDQLFHHHLFPPAFTFLNPNTLSASSSVPFEAGAIPSSSPPDLLSPLHSSYNLLMATGATFSSGHSYDLHATPLIGRPGQPNPSVHPEHGGFTGLLDVHVDHQLPPSGGHNVLAAAGGSIRSRKLPISRHPPAPSSASRVLSDHQMKAGRNPKKRPRASRRAPTTVLTTDTTNFRAMVQEFTGIPELPFSSSSLSRRIDLLGSGSALRSAGSGNLEAIWTAGYPFRPSTQNLQQRTSSPLAASTSSPVSSSPSLNMPHPLLTFRSLLVQQPQGNMPMTSNAFEETAAVAAGSEERPSGGGYLPQRISKLNYSTTTSLSEIQHDKGLGNVISSSRGEGGMDAWIFPLD
ncbi:hypothetical protein SAY86_027390 [Trapa natans]|uniref:VQ domain-containing protein n=1 Tax=Trapa natans TaxID=22666 RepID=A0AAN7KSZ6_TRANT|nr:hypothetical protein SAY86_027390 [Trapa natans]